MQKKKKVSKMKTSDKKAKAPVAKPSAKVAAKPAAKKAVEKPAAKKEVAPKEQPVQQAAPKVKAPKGKAAKVKVEAKPAHTAENPATNAPISKDDFKNMSADGQEHYKKWLKLHKQLSVEKAFDYKMTEDFEIKAPLSHKVHGWGVVMQKRDNYIDVLFEAGLKTLIVNYKP